MAIISGQWWNSFNNFLFIFYFFNKLSFLNSYIINLTLSILCTLLLIIKLHGQLNCLITFYDHLKTISKDNIKYKNIIFKEQENTFIVIIGSIFDFINNNKNFVFIKKTLNLNYMGDLNLNPTLKLTFIQDKLNDL